VKHDPKQLFVITTISRKDIAEMLNNSIDAAGATDVDRFKRDDPRLTDKVCREVANLIYDADSAHDDGMAEANMAAADTFLGSLPAHLRKRPASPKKRKRRK
jgi:hypothetical protein